MRTRGPEICFSALDAASVCTTGSRRCTHSWPYGATLAPPAMWYPVGPFVYGLSRFRYSSETPRRKLSAAWITYGIH